MMFEVNISFTIHWKQVDMSMIYLKTEHNLCHFLTGESCFNGTSYPLGKHFKLGQLIIIHVENIVNLPARYNQSVPLCDGINVEKRIELIAFGTFVAWDLPCCNL